jgi:hypothetical protein
MINLKTLTSPKHMSGRKEKNMYMVLMEISEGKNHLKDQSLDG